MKKPSRGHTQLLTPPILGTIRSVEVFPSQYGLQRIEEERMKGPDITPIETEEEEFNEAALRKYQVCPHCLSNKSKSRHLRHYSCKKYSQKL